LWLVTPHGLNVIDRPSAAIVKNALCMEVQGFDVLPARPADFPGELRSIFSMAPATARKPVSNRDTMFLSEFGGDLS